MAAIYYSPTLRRQHRLTLWLASTAAVSVPLLYGMTRAYYGYTRFGPAAASFWSLPWLGASGLLFLACVALFARLKRRSDFGILLYRDGLRLGNIEPLAQHLPPKLPPLLPWDEVSGIAVEWIATFHDQRPIHRAVLFLKGGKKITLAETHSRWDALANLIGPIRIENLPELVTRLKARLYTRLLPKLRAGLLSGQALPFSPVIIHRQQLAFRSKRQAAVPWTRVKRVTVQSGNLVVELENPQSTYMRLHFPISQIPNLELLLNLIEEYSC